MIFTTLQSLLGNFCFISLFATMIFYWIKGSFFYTKETKKFEAFFLISTNVALISILVIRWIESKHFPLSNLYESLLFLSWSLLTVLLFLQFKANEPFLGIILTPIILFINTFATFSLPAEMQKASSLVPALQSNWLMMHVTIMMISYAALISGSLLSVTFLLLNSFYKKNENFPFVIKNNVSNQFQSSIVNTASTASLSSTLKNPANSLQSDQQMITIFNTLDNLSYRTIGIGFPLLTIGILSGAVWANETWGSYWSWDPKETWAFITWLIYSIYLHSRIIKGARGKKPAMIASIGFLTVWVCYLGVNIFGKGLHSYGWFS